VTSITRDASEGVQVLREDLIFLVGAIIRSLSVIISNYAIHNPVA
jgi:hypothetical protein